MPLRTTGDEDEGFNIITPSPPMPNICGFTRPSTNIAPAAASKALPPSRFKIEKAVVADRFECVAIDPCVPA